MTEFETELIVGALKELKAAIHEINVKMEKTSLEINDIHHATAMIKSDDELKNMIKEEISNSDLINNNVNINQLFNKKTISTIIGSIITIVTGVIVYLKNN